MDNNAEYSILLHIIEGIGFNEKNDEITLNATLNGVKFEIEGHNSGTTTIFNSNCIWECMYDDLKRMRTDNRPIKIECFHKPTQKNGKDVKKAVGFVLLPLRTVQMVKNLRNLQIKLRWHRLCGLAAEWRTAKPELYLSVIVTTKELMESRQLEEYLEPKPVNSSGSIHIRPSETSLMLQPQLGIYVKLLEDECLLQVGNGPLDRDLFVATLTLNNAKHLNKLSVGSGKSPMFRFHYEFLGCPSDVALVGNSDGVYNIYEKISVSFKSSLTSLKDYFKRVFYIPIDLYYNDSIIGNYKFTCGKLLPSSLDVFSEGSQWQVTDSFALQTLFEIFESSDRPTVEYIFSLSYIPSVSPVHSPPTIDKKARGDMGDVNALFDLPPTVYAGEEKTDREAHSAAKENDDLEKLKFCRPDSIVSCSKHIEPSPADDLASVNPVQSQPTIDKKARGDMADVNALFELPPTICGTEEISELQVHSATNKNDREKEKIVKFCRSEPLVSCSNPKELTPLDDLAYEVIAELEDWKCQQMENFLTELKRKELFHLRQLSAEWDRQKMEMTQKLQDKLDECSRLTESLEQAQVAVRAKALRQLEEERAFEKTQHELDKRYTVRFMEMEENARRIKDDMDYELKLQELLFKEQQMEQNRIAAENAKLQLKAELDELRKNSLPKEQLAGLLEDLREQSERYSEMEKSKRFYKQEWSKLVKEVHKLKLQSLKVQEEKLKQSNVLGIDNIMDLRNMIFEERSALLTDRSELKTIKEAIASESDESTKSNCA